MKPTINKKIGNLGEEISARYLKEKSFKIVERNWNLPKIGEIDIIAKKNNVWYFIEIKTTTNLNSDTALEHLDKNKMKKFQRVVNHYLIKNNLIDSDYKLSGIICELDLKTKKAKINFIPDFY